jgi:hypothetical protein
MISGYGPSGLIFRNELAISPAGISWKGKFHPLDSITRVGWGGVRKSVNGVYTGTDYTIGFGDNHSEQVIKLKQESIYNSFVEALWRAVCVRLVIEMLRALRAHTRPLSSPLDPGPVAALAPHHLVSLLEGALAFAILACWHSSALGPPGPDGRAGEKWAAPTQSSQPKNQQRGDRVSYRQGSSGVIRCHLCFLNCSRACDDIQTHRPIFLAVPSALGHAAARAPPAAQKAVAGRSGISRPKDIVPAKL